MKIETINNKAYKLPNELNNFQKELYVHLINYKWKYITKKVGLYKYRNTFLEYDAILPEEVQDNYPIIYPSVLADVLQHLNKFPFKLHTHFNHMASSQAANVNLFVPILLSPKANEILKLLKPDFKELAVAELYKGFRIEYWDGNSNKEKGLLGDHSAIAGTDSDIAIAYYNQSNELCLWLIEHKLTEAEFSVCGGATSKGKKPVHNCTKTFSEITENKETCYYHSGSNYNYWNITENHKDFFVNNNNNLSCPFQNGMNQLWRNQLLGFAIEDDKTNNFKNVDFSVVHHPDNHSLDASINAYKNLVDNNSKFSSFTSKDVIDKALIVKDKEIDSWITWYRELYNI
ncbi:PGN_0703 family putative restriction endonuclease [Lutibacter maritimus]|uniref:Uncharacterized protein n=1 Tax=Lutibacter maritimus TaxID=593133 RepID=A0A1I6REP4_9FLAO|nr:hypothetical protein [Lutibacter maritimus]SFS63116.1 hypothetical protein SAMN04488006_2393 [Lutibacter maritimus]